ncbi:D-galactonate dehydratase [Mesorhizobium sp. B2-3-3]|nr:D-galactonate dehydratase [Mesorhizobium sp. B2-3-3]
MKITGIRTVVVNAKMRNWVFVRVDTSVPGLYGWGEATLNWKTRAVTGAVEDLAQLMIGTDPSNIEQAVRRMNKHSYYRLGIIGASAISGIEHALWDISAKELGVPVWRMLGGKVRERVDLYSHPGLGEMKALYDDTFDPSLLVASSRAVIEKGFHAVKIVPLPYTNATTTRTACRNLEKLGIALREGLGDDVAIMVDFHGRASTVSATLEYIKALEPMGPMFVEEPVQPGDTRAMREIVERSNVPIATGERLVGLREFADLLDARACNIVQPDLNHCGGLLEGKKVAALAELAQAGVAPHNPNGPLAAIASLHYGISTPNFVILEAMPGTVPWYDDVVTGMPEMVDGRWAAPDKPGFGVEVDEKEAVKHPFQQEVLHIQTAVLDDGTLVDW